MEFSLPKVITGNNLYQVNDIGEAMDRVNERLAEIDLLPKVNVFDAILTRLDIMYDHDVGDLTPFYIDTLSKLDHPYRKTHTYLGESVYFNSDKTVLKFYDKFAESEEDERARGLLRQELSLKDTRTVNKRMGTNSLSEIRPSKVEEELNKELRWLRILEASLASEPAAAIRLVEKFGLRAGLYFTGLRFLNGKVPLDRLAAAGPLHHRSLDRQISKIIDARVAPVSSDYDGNLPPLEVKIIRGTKGEGNKKIVKSGGSNE